MGWLDGTSGLFRVESEERRLLRTPACRFIVSRKVAEVPVCCTAAHSRAIRWAMPLRLEVAYGLIALLVIAAILGAILYRRKRQEDRRINRGGRPRKR